MFLNSTCELEKYSEQTKSGYLVFKDNPLAEYVILPPKLQNDLWYSNILCGIIKGAFDQISISAKVEFKHDVLRGDETTAIFVQLKDSGRKSKDGE